MNTAAKVIIGVLAVAIVGLGIGLGVALAKGGDDGTRSGGYWNSNGDGDAYYRMMDAMGRGDWQAMQDDIRQFLGDDGYRQMQEHMRTDGCSWASGDDDMDGFMHDSMYGMMYRAFNNGATPVPGTGCW